jgi:hypothetical protein
MQKPFYSANEAFSGIVPSRHVDYFLREEEANAWASAHGGTVIEVPDGKVPLWKVRRKVPGHEKRLQVALAVGDPAKEQALVEDTGAADFNDLFGRG